jgi:hypothetical protein
LTSTKPSILNEEVNREMRIAEFDEEERKKKGE